MSESNIYPTPYGRFLLYPHDWVSSHIIKGKFWDECLKNIFDRLIEDCTVVEVGSNVGFHTVYLSKKVKKVYAFEPQQHIYYQLCGNLFINNCNNVIAFPYAVYSKVIDMDIAPQHLQDSSCPAVNGPYNTIFNIAGISLQPKVDGSIKSIVLDEYLSNIAVDCLKIDAQGCDLHALQGAVNMISKYKPLIIFEFEESLAANHGHSFLDYQNFFKVHNYNIQDIGSHNYIGISQ